MTEIKTPPPTQTVQPWESPLAFLEHAMNCEMVRRLRTGAWATPRRAQVSPALYAALVLNTDEVATSPWLQAGTLRVTPSPEVGAEAVRFL